MHSFLVVIYHNDEVVLAEQVIGTINYLDMLYKASLIIADKGNPDEYRLEAVTHFGDKDPEAAKTVIFESKLIRDLAWAAKAAGMEYEVPSV